MSEPQASGAAPAGWYPHQTMAGTLRYWDGQNWTDHVAAQTSAPNPTKPARVNWKVLVVTLATVAVAFAGAWYFLGYNSDESKATRACHDYVEDRLKAPATADFSDEFAVKEEGNTYTAYGNVDSENGFGAKVRNAFTCEVTSGIVTDSHFSEDDDN
jgi:hypothetical protein